MCEESIVLKFPCRWSRYHMLRSASPSKFFNGPIIERKTADTTIPWHGMSGGLEYVVFNSHTSTDYVLEGAELSASSDSWAGNWACRGRAAWLRSETPLGPGLISAVLRLPSSPVKALWPAVCSASPGEWTGPPLPLDELSLMAASLKAWRGPFEEECLLLPSSLPWPGIHQAAWLCCPAHMMVRQGAETSVICFTFK